MEDSREERKLMVGETIGNVFGIIMVVLYFILGTTFVFYAPERIPDQFAKGFGIALYCYAIFRLFKYVWKFFG